MQNLKIVENWPFSQIRGATAIIREKAPRTEVASMNIIAELRQKKLQINFKTKIEFA